MAFQVLPGPVDPRRERSFERVEVTRKPLFLSASAFDDRVGYRDLVVTIRKLAMEQNHGTVQRIFVRL
ncbi:hypothetical protein H6P81_009912 [Aristolochia fimbriata]|uniref:Uncharacterized protein n=1 Tax=Aristolochia fimbriata TaxID=158543 RepID=A0AAV7EM95_ARIFI|nr:hypothetical protein H6P81_009912 [Aristolochia fimbriata]